MALAACYAAFKRAHALYDELDVMAGMLWPDDAVRVVAIDGADDLPLLRRLFPEAGVLLAG